MRAPRFVAAVAVVAVAALAGCSGGSGSDSTPTGGSPATTAADGTTVPGTALELGAKAVVKFQADKKHRSQIKLAVTKVTKGKVKDLARFKLRKAARNSNVYYVSTTVKNLGPDTLTGARITLYGKVSDTLVVRPVRFGSTFPKCNQKPFPKKFVTGKSVNGCMVMLAPKRGTVSEVQWRPANGDLPISWTVR